MKYLSVCVFAAATALLWCAARAQAEGVGSNLVPSAGNPVPPPKVTPPSQPGRFAAAAAANSKPMPPEQREERNFLKEAAATSRFSSEAARMALGKSSNAGVRSVAATLVNHHASASPVLQHMLHNRGMAAPMLANDQRKTLNRLAKLSGPKFDREFMEQVGQRSQHGEVQLFERASLTAKDPILKAWIDKTLPTLRFHASTVQRGSPQDARLANGLQRGITQPVSARATESNTR